MPQEFFTVGSLFGLTSADLFYKIAKAIIITKDVTIWLRKRKYSR